MVMEENRSKKFVDALRDFAETIAFMGMIRPESFHWLWVTASRYFFILSLTHAIRLIWRNAIKVDNLIKVIKKWN